MYLLDYSSDERFYFISLYAVINIENRKKEFDIIFNITVCIQSAFLFDFMV